MFTITTANKKGEGYCGVLEEDDAFVRRLLFSVNLDVFPPTVHDIARLLQNQRAKTILSEWLSMTEQIIRIYESLQETLEYKLLTLLYFHYMSGRGTCIRTRSGPLRTNLQPAICEKCHLQKSHPFCGRVGGVSEGQLLRLKEVAAGMAAIRAAKVVQRVREDCLAGRCRNSLIQRRKEPTCTRNSAQSISRT